MGSLRVASFAIRSWKPAPAYANYYADFLKNIYYKFLFLAFATRRVAFLNVSKSKYGSLQTLSWPPSLKTVLVPSTVYVLASHGGSLDHIHETPAPDAGFYARARLGRRLGSTAASGWTTTSGTSSNLHPAVQSTQTLRLVDIRRRSLVARLLQVGYASGDVPQNSEFAPLKWDEHLRFWRDTPEARTTRSPGGHQVINYLVRRPERVCRPSYSLQRRNTKKYKK
jgi:hypothetical protein